MFIKVEKRGTNVFLPSPNKSPSAKQGRGKREVERRWWKGLRIMDINVVPLAYVIGATSYHFTS